MYGLDRNRQQLGPLSYAAVGQGWIAILSGVIAVGVYVAATSVSASRFPTTFVPDRNWLSDLGNELFNPSGASIYNGGVIAAGIALAAFFWGFAGSRVRRSPEQPLRQPAVRVLGLVSGATTIASAVDSEGTNQELHGWISVWNLETVGTAVLLAAVFAWQPQRRWTLVLAIAVLTEVVALLFASIIRYPSTEWALIALILGYGAVVSAAIGVPAPRTPRVAAVPRRRGRQDPSALGKLARTRRLPRTLLVLLVTLSLAATAAPGRALAGLPLGFAQIDQYVRDEMTASALPGLSYAIVRDGEIAHLAAFGTADSSGRAMTTDTPVVIGSVGKTMTALAIRQLIEAGKVDENAPLQRYLPWFTLAQPEAAARITIRDLLEHTSGLSKADGQRPGIFAPGLTSEEVLRQLRSVALNRPVGTYEYSNLNFIALGVVVEAVSGEPYADYLDAHVFTPLGMDHSHAAIEPARRDGLAEGHRYLFGVPVAFDEPYPTAIVPAGYQISSAADMARYVAAFSNHGRYHATDIVGATDGDRDYGIDWAPVTGVPWGYTPGHSGATISSNAGLVYMPVAHVGVVVLTNANPTELWFSSPRGASEIAFDVLRFTLGEEALTAGPTVRTAYLVIDAALLLLGAFVLVEGLRLRGWRRRLGEARRPRMAVATSMLFDGALPLAILVGLPLWVGTTGVTPPLDVLGTWAVAMWTLPDVAVSLLALSAVLLAIGVIKVWQLRSRTGDQATRPGELGPAAVRAPTEILGGTSTRRGSA